MTVPFGRAPIVVMDTPATNRDKPTKCRRIPYPQAPGLVRTHISVRVSFDIPNSHPTSKGSWKSDGRITARSMSELTVAVRDHVRAEQRRMRLAPKKVVKKKTEAQIRRAKERDKARRFMAAMMGSGRIGRSHR